MSPVGDLDHEKEFERAWAEPRYTRFERPAADVNRVLAARYRIGKPLVFTRAMLWDVEIRKAWRPDIYIPSTVHEGMAESWGHRTLADGGDTFFRKSAQRQWLEPDRYELVLEMVRLNPAQQKVTFVGAAELPDRAGDVLRAGKRQPLFHVEHSVGGTGIQPLNEWRIVSLTDQRDERLIEQLAKRADQACLPEFIEIYIRDDIEPFRLGPVLIKGVPLFGGM